MNNDLRSWLAIWHPRYRAALMRLFLAGAMAAGLVYLQNSLLGLLTPSLAMSFQAESASSAATGIGRLQALAHRIGLWLPLLVLGLFIVVRGLSAGIEFWKTHVNGRLRARAEADLEGQILQHLLRNDDAFFSRHSPAETVNRLAVDLFRVSDRRSQLTAVWWSALLMLGNLVFFFLKDWRLALVALAGCAAGALWTQRMTRHVKGLDAKYLRQNDGIKSRFEDFLRAAPEVQVGRLYEKIGREFSRLQEGRTGTFLKYVRLNAWLSVGNVASSLLAFAAMILVILYQLRTGSVSLALGLVPVVIWALPALFQQAAQLVVVHVQFQLARTSMDRLLEYQTHCPPEEPAGAPEPPGRGQALALQNVTYRYEGPGGAQGGISDVTADFSPGTWTAIAGGAGSGKSTLLKLLLGRLRPQAGKILYGSSPLEQVPPATLAQVLSLMPQSPGLLNATIRQNVLFGRDQQAQEITAEDLAVLEQTGLAEICRVKALDMTTGIVDGDALAGLAAMRSDLRAVLQEECGAVVLPYEAGNPDGEHWVVERLLGGRCDRPQAAGILLSKPAKKALLPLRKTPLGQALAEAGRRVLRAARRLLEIPTYQAYCQLAPRRLDERVWKLRHDCAELADQRPQSAEEDCSLLQIALTSAAAEAGGLKELHPDQAWTEAMATLLGRTCQPLEARKLHPYLTWRENLLFGVLQAANSTLGRKIDQAVLGFLNERGLAEALTRVGLDYRIGRLGGNLSGGQGQLVALCRAALRRTPVLVLDEPTSALDPASSMRVATFLKGWKAGRVVITVSHNPEFMRQADEVKLMDAGRLAASGSFERLQESSDIFRRTLQQP